MDDEVMAIEQLPGDVLARAFRRLPPADLACAELVCRRFRSEVASGEVWRALAERALPQLSQLGAQPDMAAAPALGPAGTRSEHGCRAAGRASAVYKRLCHLAAAPPAVESLVAEALAASSTDHEEESVANVLTPVARRDVGVFYWSSSGSQDADVVDSLAFRLAHPLCLVHHFDLRPFRAWFQPGGPTYSPQRMRLVLGGRQCFTAAGEALPTAELAAAAAIDVGAGGPGQSEASFSRSPPSGPGELCVELPPWQVGPDAPDAPVRYNLPRPTLCVGGYVRLELLGRTQRQEEDQQFYNCVCYVQVLGTPLTNFALRALPASVAEPAPPPPGAGAQQRRYGLQYPPQQQQRHRYLLQYLPVDPLQAAGGLRAVSEGGRLARGDSDSDDPSDDFDLSSSDGDDGEHEGAAPSEDGVLSSLEGDAGLDLSGGSDPWETASSSGSDTGAA